jgi:NitT/TauT family transport system substrate-binding protein
MTKGIPIVNRLVRAAAMLAAFAVAASTASASAADLAKVRMTTFGTCGEIWNWWAQAKGIYTKYGLDVEQVHSTGGAAAVAAIVSNSVDIGYVNGFTTIIGYTQGLPLEVLSNVQATAMPPLPNAQGIWVKADSPFKSPTELKGKKIGVNEIAGINMIVTQAWLKRRGVDPATVKFVALPFPDLIPAVVSGTIDATSSPTTRAMGFGHQIRSIADPFVDAGSKVLIAMYVANRDWVAKNPKTAQAFHDAVREAIADVNKPANHDAAIDVEAAGCKGDAAQLRNLPDNANESAVDMGAFHRMAQFLIDQKILPSVPDLNPLVASYARR